MAMCIGHREGGVIIIDALRERRPPFSPDSIVDEFAIVLKSYRVSKVVGDRYAGEWPRERFRLRDVTYEPSAAPKSDLYRDALPLINAARINLIDDKRLIAQLCGLERRAARSGRGSIDHMPGQHDDVANAVAGCASLLAVDSVLEHGDWIGVPGGWDSVPYFSRSGLPVPVTTQRRVDDDEAFDADLYDPAYFPRKVVRDGKGLRVRLSLTDGAPPDWMRLPRHPVFDARHHQPRFANLTDARLQDGLKQAAEARDAWIRGLQDAWRSKEAINGAAHTTAPPAPGTARARETHGSEACRRLIGRRLAKPPLTMATTTLRLFVSSGFPLARHPVPALAIATRGLLFHEKRRTRPSPTVSGPTPDMLTVSSTRGGLVDPRRHPSAPAGSGATKVAFAGWAFRRRGGDLAAGRGVANTGRGDTGRKALTEAAEDLDTRIGAVFGGDAESSDAARLLAEVKEATSAAELAAETARKHALDPLLSGDALKLARREMEDAAFARDRLHEAETKLAERIEALMSLEVDRRLQAAHERVEAERDQLFGEMENMADAIAQIAHTVSRIAICDREIGRLNATSTSRFGYVLPVLSGAAPAAAVLFGDAIVWDTFIAIARLQSPPVASGGAAEKDKLRVRRSASSPATV